VLKKTAAAERKLDVSARLTESLEWVEVDRCHLPCSIENAKLHTGMWCSKVLGYVSQIYFVQKKI
jgi:hypothetical protein